MLNHTPYSVHIYGQTSFIAQSLIRIFKKSNVEFHEIPRDFDFASSLKYAKSSSEKRNILVSMAWKSNRSGDYQVSEENFFWISHSLRIAKWCQRHNFELMIPGSCLEYSEQAQSNYVISKKELYKELASNEYNITYYWPRIFYAFSVKLGRPRILRSALIAKESNKEFELKYPEEKHDYIEVTDVAQQLKSILDLRKSGSWDVGTGLLHSNRELILGLGVHLSDASNLDHIDESFMVSDSWNQPAMRLFDNQTAQISSTLDFFSKI